MHFALVTGLTAMSGGMSFGDVNTTSGLGLILVETEIPAANRAAAYAILSSFAHEPKRGGAAHFRFFTIALEALFDDRIGKWLLAGKQEGRDLFPALVQAIATLPISFDNEGSTASRVFRLAAKIEAARTKS